jgi:hypothetical protein
MLNVRFSIPKATRKEIVFAGLAALIFGLSLATIYVLANLVF